jgi:hypothetical protein
MSFSSNASFTLRKSLGLFQANTSVHDYYVFGAKGTPWPTEYSPPALDDAPRTFDYQIPNEILFGKYIQSTDISYLINRYDWVSGTVYAMYDDLDTELFTKQFYVSSMEAGVINVFKCLNNNSNAPSTHQPLLSETSADDELYQTNDGYTWKYMYTISSSMFSQFATTDYIPVLANSAVVGNATSGSIDSLILNSIGNPLYSTTNGYFNDLSVGGNSQVYALQGSDTTILRLSTNTVVLGETVTQSYAGALANGVISSYSQSNTSFVITLKNVSGVFSTSNTVYMTTSNTTSTVYDTTTSSISSNNGFYVGSSLYIMSGTGAGQIANITDYTVIGNTRRATLDVPFVSEPDFTSKYLISPQVKIIGDGSNAAAYSVINTTTNNLQTIQIINKGINYSYANVSLIGNSGISANTANIASIRAIISPNGGHGNNPTSELNASYLSFATSFANSGNGKLPVNGSTYRRIGVMSDPLFANVTLAYTYNILPLFPTDGVVTVSGSISNASGIVTGSNPVTNSVSLTTVSGLFQSGDILTATYANGYIFLPANSSVAVTTISGQGTLFDNRVSLSCPISSLTGGVFAVNEKVVQVTNGVDTAYGYVQSITTTGNTQVIELTETLGTFNNSNTVSGTYKYLKDDATRVVSIEIDQIVGADLIKYSGDIFYVENMIPITRNTSQSESVNIIISFT